MENMLNELLQVLQNNSELVILGGIAAASDAVLGWVKKSSVRWPGITLIAGKWVCVGLAKMFNRLADWFETAIER